MKRPKPKYDILWKGMIENVMEDLLLFIDPDIGKELDLERGFEYLDKELAKLYPDPEKPTDGQTVKGTNGNFRREKDGGDFNLSEQLCTI